MVDLIDPPNTDGASSWENPSRWQNGAYPMDAVSDLGDQYRLVGVEYFVGSVNQGRDRVIFEYSADQTGEDFVPLVTVDNGHDWGTWRTVPLADQVARRVRISFDRPFAAFGYVANTLGAARHEDHLGHKVTVARFRASMGNGAGSNRCMTRGLSAIGSQRFIRVLRRSMHFRTISTSTS